MNSNVWDLVGQAYQVIFMLAIIASILYFWKKEIKENGWF